jgi:16S rRNA G966 N2-methylase RsmD
LLEWLVATYTNEGDTVLDPFAGSFATALACLSLGRRCIAVEKEEEYFEVGVERLKSMWHSNMFIGGIDDVPTIAPPSAEAEVSEMVVHSPAV